MRGFKICYWVIAICLLLCMGYVYISLKSDLHHSENMGYTCYTTVDFEDAVLQVGTVNLGETISLEFNFMNTGSYPLLIRNVRTTCGCTKAIWEKKPLLPQRKGKIQIDFTGMHKGHFVKTIYVLCNVERQFHQLQIDGDVIEL